MKDLLGNEVQIGDKVVFRLPNPDRDLGMSNDTLVVGTIEKFTPKGMRAIYNCSYQYQPNPRQIDGMSTKHLYDKQFVKV